MEIGVKKSDDGNGFFLTYTTEVNSPTSEKKIRYIYKNGQFIHL